MARNERRSLDNFDVDSNLDFDLVEFDDIYTPKQQSRNPVSKIGLAALKGAVSALTGFGTIKKVILRALPKEYGEIDRAFSAGVRTSKDLYHETLKDLKPTLRDFNRSAKRALPEISKQLPDKLGDKLNKLGNKLPQYDNEWKGSSPEELKEQALQAQVGAVFQQGQAQTAIGQQQLAQSIMSDRASALQHGQSMQYLNAIRIGVQSLDNYNTSVTVNYQRKSLEIQVRQLGLTADLVNDNRRFAAEYMKRFDNIQHNTSLPDYVKLKASERYKEAIRNRFIGKSIDTAAERSREFMTKFGKNVQAAIKDKIDSIKMAFEAGTMGLEGMADQAEMMRDMQEAGIMDESLVEMLSGQAGGSWAEKKAMQFGNWGRKQLDQRGGKRWGKVNYAGKEAARRLSDIPGTLDDIREGRLFDKFIPQWARDLIPTMSPDTAFTKQRVGDLQQAGIYTERTDKTINTVIPGLLARQLRELTMLRTGKADVELLTYDHFKDDFVSKASMTENIFKKTVSQDMRSAVQGNRKKFDEYFYGNDENAEPVSAETKDKFYNFLLNQSIHGRSADAGRFSSEDSFAGGGFSTDEIEMLSGMFRRQYGYDSAGKAIPEAGYANKRGKFQEMFKGIGDPVQHQQEVIQTLMNAGYTDELRRIGLIDESGYLDKKRYYDYLNGADYSSSGVIDRPEYEGTNQRGPKRRKGKVVRAYKTTDLNEAQEVQQQSAQSANQLGSRTENYSNLDSVIEAIKESNIKSIATIQSETLQRIEAILIEKEFGNGKPGAIDRVLEGGSKVKEWFKTKYSRLSGKFEGVRAMMSGTQTRARTVMGWLKQGFSFLFDKAKKHIPGLLNKGWDMTKDAANWSLEKGKQAAQSAWDFGRDVALPKAKDAAGWGWEKAKKGAGWGWEKTKQGAGYAREKLGQLLGGLTEGSEEGEGLFGKLGGKVKSGLGWLSEKGGAVGKGLSKMFGGASTGKQTVSLLTQIRDILDSRLPGKKKKFDRDGSGSRDGSWEDQLSSRAQRRAGKAGGAPGDQDSGNKGLLSKLAGLLPFGRKKNEEDEEEEDSSLLDDATAAADLASTGSDLLGGGDDDDGDSDGREEGDGRRRRRGRRGFWNKAKSFGGKALKFGGKALGLAGAAYGAYSMVDNLSQGNYGGAAVDAGLTVGGLALSGVTLGSMVGGAGAALGGLTSLALGAGGLLISAPALGAAGLALAGYGLYKGYKWLTQFRLGDLSRIRYMQYGFNPEDGTHVPAVFGFEEKISELTSMGGGVPKVDESKLKYSDVAEGFGLDPKNPRHAQQFTTWYTTRFKPVFLTWYAGANTSGLNKPLRDLDKATDAEKLALLSKVTFANGPYDRTVSPFADLGSLAVNGPAIENSIKVLKAELETKVKAGGGTVAPEAVAATGTAAAVATTAQLSGEKPSTGPSTEKNGHLTLASTSPGAVGAAALGMAATIRPDGGNVVELQLRELSPIESIRMRVYGIREMDTVKIGAIMRLEADVRSMSAPSGDVVVWKGDIYQLANRVQGLFRFSGLHSAQGENWMRWFRYRFLPTYLTYLTGLFKLTGSMDRDADYKTLKPAQAIDLANRVSGATSDGQTVWKITDSPFPGYSLGTDPGVLAPFIDVIAKAAQVGAIIKEDAVQQMDNQTAASVRTAATGQVPVTGRTDAPQSTWDKIKSFGSSAASAMGSVLETTKNVIAGAANVVTSTFGPTPQAPSGPGMVGTGPTAGTYEGNGGKADSLPEPKGGAGYAAFKDLIDAAAKAVGVDNRLLAIICAIESGFRPAIKAPTSSATGLFQFIKKTWEGMLAKFGKLFGIPIFTPPSDPKAACLMGAQFLKDNIQYLQKALGRKVTFVEAYMAHFLGPAGAAGVLKYPGSTVLAPLMPKAAMANTGVFFRSGRALSLSEIYNDFAKKMTNYAKKYGIDITDADLAQPTSTSPAEKTAEKTENKAEAEMANVPTPPTTAATGGAPGVTPGSVPASNIQPVGFTPNAEPTIPTGSTAPNPIGQASMSSSDIAAKQNVADKQYQAESGAIESILKQSLEVQLTQAKLLAEISQKLDNGTTFANQTVPDPRTDQVSKTSRPMPNAPVPLRRVM